MKIGRTKIKWTFEAGIDNLIIDVALAPETYLGIGEPTTPEVSLKDNSVNEPTVIMHSREDSGK